MCLGFSALVVWFSIGGWLVMSGWWFVFWVCIWVCGLVFVIWMLYWFGVHGCYWFGSIDCAVLLLLCDVYFVYELALGTGLWWFVFILNLLLFW